ncbi:MAG: ABC transporter ATP-binding protein [Deltaproteobacteria bacterium]|nr:MAG: ABC transporter ATP-binding protein [Deltaproteobacteria bacterium]
MNSISISEKHIATVKGLRLAYNLDYFEANNLRDFFVKGLKAPIDFLLKPKETYLALDDVNLTINRGDRIGVLGHNGSGKTTLCRCLSGMLVPTEGTVETHGEVRPIFNTTISVLPELTGRENAQMLALLLFPEMTEEERENLVKEGLEFAELGKFLDVPFKSYSRGMQARLCLSIITAKPCDLLILDEVFEGADQAFQKKISKRTLSLIEDSGAVVLVSHFPEHVEMSCNRVIIMEKSKIVFDGGVEEGVKIYRKMSNLGQL